MTPEPRFAVDVFQNEFLPDGGRDVSAIVSVTSAETTAVQTDLAGAEIIIIDCSGSMAPSGKIDEDTARLIAGVVDVVDAASGTVRLKRRVDDADEMALDTRSTKTVRTRK
jgi:hypothetical protein